MSAGHSQDSVPHTMNKGTQMGAFVHGMGNVSANLHTFAAEPKGDAALGKVLIAPGFANTNLLKLPLYSPT